ncbi:MAG: amidohydrolase [Negativicutes bacterium]|jgi:cytosine/adenosine deaminase-related metal-dependent hydrolase
MRIVIFILIMIVMFCPVAVAEQVDILIKNGIVLTMNPSLTEYRSGVVAIRDKKIVAVGTNELLDKYTAKKVIDADGGIIMPGLINTHTHVPMVAFRSLGENGVKDRLFKYFFPLEAKLVTPDMVYTATIHGVIEMAMGGVTTYCDMYYYEDQMAKATEAVGIRAVLGETVIGFAAPDAPVVYGGLDYAEQFIKNYKSGHELITPAVAPHSVYTVSPEELKKCKQLAQKYSVPLLLHVDEFKDEAERVQKKFNANPDKKSTVEYLESIGLLYDKLYAAHVIHVDENDIKLLKKYNVTVSVNTIANTKGATGTPQVLDFIKYGIRTGLGTDGPMSSNTLDIFNAMGYVARVTKLDNEDNTLLTPKEVVRLATIGGAGALGMADKIGSLEAGKYADVIIVETKSPNMIPNFDSYATLVYAAGPLNTQTVICNGKIVVEDRHLLSYSYIRDVQDMNVLSQKVWAVALILE